MAAEPTSHVNLYKSFPPGYKALSDMETALKAGPLSGTIRELVKMRSSQINGCAYCLDMHYKDARAAGETEERLYMLNAWEEATVYTDEERAALALTEAITLISQDHVPEDVEAAAREHFDDERYAALVFTIVAINSWNRLAITGHSEPGIYQPSSH
jgi:AhpD family alkylhydroperoxidase